MNCVLFFGPAKKPTLFFAGIAAGRNLLSDIIHSMHIVAQKSTIQTVKLK